MEIEVKGLSKLTEKMHSVGANVDAIVDMGLHRGAEKIRKDAMRLIKEQKAYDTGRLHGSISVESIAGGYSVGTNVKYGVFIEYGTGTAGDSDVPHTQRSFWRYKTADGKWHTAKAMRPRPFLRPALTNNKNYVVKSVRKALIDELQGRITP